MSRLRASSALHTARLLGWRTGGGALLAAVVMLAQGASAHAARSLGATGDRARYVAFVMAIDKFDSANEAGVYSYRMPRIAAGPCVLRDAIADTTSQRITGVATGPSHEPYRMSLSLYFFNETLEVRNASAPQPALVVASPNGSLETNVSRHVVVPKGSYDVFVVLKCRFVTASHP